MNSTSNQPIRTGEPSTSRKLATLQMVSKVDPIPGADRIEVVTVLGWKVVVRKGEVAPGERVVFFEIDSIIPAEEWSAFLKPPHRLRTVKLRGQISQGLVLPLTGAQSRALTCGREWMLTAPLGTDVTGFLGVTKYEPPTVHAAGHQVKGNFPTHLVNKTAELRIQSIPSLLEVCQGNPFYVTQKLDGCSGTFFRVGGEFRLCSRNMELKWDSKSDSVWHQVARKYKLDEVIPEGFAFQGEIVGPGIQGNRMGLSSLEFRLFDLWDIEEREYYGWKGLCRMAANRGVLTVPPVYDGHVFSLDLPGLLDMAKGRYPNGHPQEGIVVRVNCPDGRVSFKVINNSYLLKVQE